MPDGSYREGVASARRQARLRIAQLRQERLHKRRAARFRGGAEPSADALPKDVIDAVELVTEHPDPKPTHFEDPVDAALPPAAEPNSNGAEPLATAKERTATTDEPFIDIGAGFGSWLVR